MKYTNLVYKPESGWWVGDYHILTKIPNWVAPEEVRDAINWIVPIRPDDPNLRSADDLAADTRDELPRILFDDNGELVVVLSLSREIKKLDGPNRLAMAMNLYMIYLRNFTRRYKLPRDWPGSLSDQLKPPDQ